VKPSGGRINPSGLENLEHAHWPTMNEMNKGPQSRYVKERGKTFITGIENNYLG